LKEPNVITDDIYLSELLNRPVLDRRGNVIGKVKDLYVVPGETFPLVEGLYVQGAQGVYYISFKEIGVLNKKVVSFKGDLNALVAVKPREEEIRMVEHILDKQVVDINGVKVVRVNDIRLGRVNDHLGLIAIDVSFRGLMRRFGFKKGREGTNIPWQYLQPLESGLDHLTLTITRKGLAQMHPVDIADIISQVSIKERSTFLNALDKETAGEALYELDEETRAKIFRQMEPEEAADVLEVMEPDEAADVLGDLPESEAKEILNLMEKDEAAEVQELLVHDEDTAGGLMTTDYLSFPPQTKVEEALATIRLLANEIEMIYYLYILDPEEHLEGVLSLKDLILATPEERLENLMKTSPKVVLSDTGKKEVAELVSKYNLMAVPVVDEENHLLGIITVDDIVDILLPTPLRRRR
jgi:CBS domain-containing protein